MRERRHSGCSRTKSRYCALVTGKESRRNAFIRTAVFSTRAFPFPGLSRKNGAYSPAGMFTIGEEPTMAATLVAAVPMASAPATIASAPSIPYRVLVWLDTVRLHVGGANLEAGIAPLVVDVGHHIGDVLVRQFPCRHDAVERYAIHGQLAFKSAGNGLDRANLVGVEIVRLCQRRRRRQC